jgi:hypothetical protein
MSLHSGQMQAVVAHGVGDPEVLTGDRVSGAPVREAVSVESDAGLVVLSVQDAAA